MGTNIKNILSEEEYNKLKKTCEENGIDINNLKTEEASSIGEFAQKYPNKKIAIHFNTFLDHYNKTLQMHDVINASESEFKKLIDEDYDDEMPISKDEYSKFLLIRALLSAVWIYFYAKNKISYENDFDNEKDKNKSKEEINFLKYKIIDKKLEKNFDDIYYKALKEYYEHETKEIENLGKNYNEEKIKHIKTIIDTCKEEKDICMTITSYFICCEFEYIMKNNEFEKLSYLYGLLKHDYLGYCNQIQKDSNNAKIYL